MKLKKIIALSTAVLCCAAFLTACTDQNKKVSFNDYWKADSNTKQENLTEKLEYTVSFEKQNGLANYELEYLNGKYTTELSTEQYEGRTTYLYKTKLEIDVTYQYGTQTSEALHDSVYSEVRFEESSGFLAPISSHKEVVSHSPVTGEVSSLESCYSTHEYVVDIDYTQKVCTMTYGKEDAETTTSKVSFNKDYTALDNDQLLFAIRGVSPSVNGSGKFTVYSPYVESAQKVKFSFGNETGADFTLLKNGTETKAAIEYYPVTLSLDEANPGQSQTIWVAKTSNPSNNTYRNVVLRISTPLAYGLGTLTYNLVSVNFS